MKRGLSPSVQNKASQAQNKGTSSSTATSSSTGGTKKQSEYKNKYREIEQIGKGTSGTVFLVKSKSDKKFYIAKKIILTNLNDQERKAVEQELILLKKLRHPHVVGYKENFVEPYYMIIIMEYCEQGDLSFHIKQKLKDNDHFPENVILNWFIQLTMALDFIHEQHVLHRDVKSSNIFLTASGSIKLGDFGISKVLHSTADKAQTLIGTPYYLSPEVCENQPYTYQSDIWALGCVLFEMCALKHPFVSESLMALVVKIIREPNPNIPQHYSGELNCLIQMLLSKKPENRPRTKQIFTFPFVIEAMKNFVSSKGLTSELKNLPIKKTQLHIQKEIKGKDDKPSKPASKGTTPSSQAQQGVRGSTPKSGQQKGQVNHINSKPQEQQKSVGSTKIQRKNSNDIKKMEELIQKQMKEVKNEVQKHMVDVKNNKKIIPPSAQDHKSSNSSLSKPSTASSQTNTVMQTPQRSSETKIKQSPSGQIQQKVDDSKQKPSPSSSNQNKQEDSKTKQSPQSQVQQKQGAPLQGNTKQSSSSNIVDNKSSNSSKNSSKVSNSDDNYDKKIQEMMSNLQNKVKQEYEQIKKESPGKSPIINNQKPSNQQNQKQNIIQPQNASSTKNSSQQPTPTSKSQNPDSGRYNSNYDKSNFEMTQIEEEIQIRNLPNKEENNQQQQLLESGKPSMMDSSKKQNFHYSQKGGQNNSLLYDSNVSLNLSLTNDSVFNATAFKANLPKKQNSILTSGGREQIIEEIIENEGQEHLTGQGKSQAPSDISEYKNEFLGSEFMKSNKTEDGFKYQTVISEHIQTQMMTPIPPETIVIKELPDDKTPKQVEEEYDDFDLEDLPQRDDYIDSDDNEYEEDFEVSSEEGDSLNSQKEKNDFRLTRKNLDKELDEVIEMYKSQLLNQSGPEEYNKFKHMLNMSEIPEASVEFSSGELSKKMKLPTTEQPKSQFKKK